MHTFETPEPITVVIELNVADVQLSASDRTDTQVSVDPTNPNDKDDVAAAEHTIVDFDGGRLHIKAPKGWRQWLPLSGRETINVRVELPSGSDVRATAGVLAVRSTGRLGAGRFKAGVGNIRVEEAGPVVITVGAGDVDVDHAAGDVEIKATGRVHIGRVDGTAVVKNSNGDTSIEEVGGDLRISAANGNIIVERAHAAVHAKSANGDVRLDQTEQGTIVAETARGRVEVGVRDGVAVWLDLDTAFGTVRNDLDASKPPAAGETSVDVRARTAFGDITIRRAQPDPADAA